MFCENCGKQIADGSAFCENCGQKVQQPAAPVAPPAPAVPEKPKVTFASLMAKAKAIHQKKKWLFPVIAAVVVVAIALAILFGILGKQVSMRDYMNITAEGFDGYGYVSIDFGHTSFGMRAVGDTDVKGFDEDLEEDEYFLDMESSDISKDYRKNLKDAQKLVASIEIEYQLPEGKVNGSLSNGDVITITIECDEDRAEELGLTIKDTSFEYTVEGLKPVAKFDILSYFEVEAEGYDGYGTASLKVNKTATKKVGDITFTMEAGARAIEWQDKDGNSGNFRARLEESSNELFNGDTVKAVINTSGNMFIDDGVELIGLEKEYTIGGLKDTIKVDILQYYNVEFVGRDGDGYAGVYRKQDKLTVGDLEFDLLWREWIVDGQAKWSTDVYVDTSSNLTNGDTVTLKIGGDLSFLRAYGIVITNLEKEFTVSNLGDYASSLSEIKENADYADSAWESVKTYLYDNWNYAIHDSWANNHFGDKKIEDVNVHKMILCTYPEENIFYRNKLWLVFSAYVSDESMSQPKLYYFLVGQHNAVVHQDGTLYFGYANTGFDIYPGRDSYEALMEEWINGGSWNIEVSN